MFEAYKIGIRLSLAENVSAGIVGLTRHFRNGDIAVTQFNNRLLQVQKTLAAGAAMTGVGLFGLKMWDGPISQAKAYANQLSNINLLGMKQAEVAEVVNKAWATSREVVTTTATENLAAFRELRTAFGGEGEHTREALAMLPLVQRAKAVMEAVSGKPQEHLAYDMVKAIELRTVGGMTPEKMMAQAERMTQTLVAMGGTLNVHDFHMAIKQAKTSGMTLSDDFVYGYLPTLMAEVKTGHGGAQSAGTVLETMRRAIAGGRIPEKMIGNWLDSGMLSEDGVGRGGAKNRHVKPGAVMGTDLFLSNPYAWATTIADPAIHRLMEKRKVSFDVATAMLFGDRNAEWGVGTLIKKSAQFERDRKMIDGASGIESYNKLLKTNPQLADMALHAQWKNLQAQLGFQVLPEVIKGTMWMTDRIKELTKWFEENKGAAKAFMWALAGLSGLAFIGGNILLFSAALKGIQLIGLKSLATTLGEAGVAGGLGMLAKAAGVFMAAYAGWAAGGWLNDNVINPLVEKVSGVKGATLGTYIYDLTHPNEGKELTGTTARAPYSNEGRNRYVKPAEQKPIVLKGDVNMDGRKVGTVMWNQLGTELQRPQAGRGPFDSVMSLQPPQY